MPSKIVCGLKEPKKGEKRGSASKCHDKHQIRYYGLVAVDPEILLKKNRTKTLLDEQIAYKRLQDEAVVLINKSKKLQIIIKEDSYTKKQKAKAKNDMKTLVGKRDALKDRMALQMKRIKKKEKENKKGGKSGRGQKPSSKSRVKKNKRGKREIM